jgi:hypothetical protein
MSDSPPTMSTSAADPPTTRVGGHSIHRRTPRMAVDCEDWKAILEESAEGFEARGPND